MSKIPHILIRADGSTTLGMGHLYRSLALVQMLEAKYNVTFICKEITPDFAYILTKNNYDLIEIENENQFLDHCNEDQIVIIDGHHFPSDLYKRVQEKGSKIVCIDDLHDKKYTADVIINQALGLTPQDYDVSPFAYYGLGPDYALLREPFLKVAQNKREIKSISSCFICFGGGDQLDLTLRVAKIAIHFEQLKKINIVTGSAYQHIDSIAEFAKTDDRINLLHAIDEYKMAEIMLSSDLAIVPCSTILLEVFAAGCIPISGYYVENQKYFYQNFLAKNAFIDAGNFSNIGILIAVDKALNSENQLSEIIDGKSNQRIQKCFQLLDNINSIKLTHASDSDTNITYKWASDPEVRKWSFNTNPIIFEEHKNWFAGKVNDAKCIYYIAKLNSEAIGSIRFDIEDSTATISYLLDPAFQGQGLGQALLIQGCKKFANSFVKQNQSIDIIGYVSHENIPSQRIFENIGFEKIIDNDKFKYSYQI